MVPGDLDPSSGLRGDGKTRLHSAVDPICDLTGFDPTVRRETKNGRALALHEFLNRQPRACLRIVYEGARDQTFPNAWAGSNDDQVRLLEASGFCVQVVEAARHAGDNRLILVDLLDLVPARFENVFEGAEVLRDPAFGNVEDDALGS